MKRPGYIVWSGVGICAVCCLLTVLAAIHVWFATSLTGPVLTTDEILACLTLVITLVGVLVAVAAIGIGAAAIFGYAELRTMTFRKTEEQLRKIIDKLKVTGDLSEAAAKVLLESIEVEPGNKTAPPHPGNSGTRVDIHTTNVRPYPNDDKEAK